MDASSHNRTSLTSVRSSVPSSWRANAMPCHLRHSTGTFRNSRGQNLSYVALFPPVTATTSASTAADSTSTAPLSSSSASSSTSSFSADSSDDNPNPSAADRHAAANQLRGVVVYVHGLGVHSRRYFHVYEQLCEAGFGAVAYDLLGHGESDLGRHRVRAHAEKFQYFVDDTNAFVTFVKETVLPEMLGTAAGSGKTSTSRTDDVPFIMLGSSYGSLIAMHTLLAETHTFAGLMLVAPAVSVEWRPVLRLQALVVRPMAVLLPKVRAVPAVKYELLCRDPAFLEDFDNDPLTVTDKMTLRMGAQSLKAFAALRKDTRFADPSSALSALPVLFMMGSADKVTSLSLAVEYFDKMGSRDKRFKVFEGMFHTLFDDPEKDEVFAYMTEWLTTRFPTAAERRQQLLQQQWTTPATTRRQYDLMGDADESWKVASSGSQSHSSSSGHRRRDAVRLI